MKTMISIFALTTGLAGHVLAQAAPVAPVQPAPVTPLQGNNLAAPSQNNDQVNRTGPALSTNNFPLSNSSHFITCPALP